MVFTINGTSNEDEMPVKENTSNAEKEIMQFNLVEDIIWQ